MGWRLWSGITLTGETEPIAPPASFGWWQYTTNLMLRMDGELVASTERDGTMRSPNNDRATDSPGPASDEVRP